MSTRSLVVFTALCLAVAGLAQGQTCKLDFRTTRQGRTVVRPLSASAADAIKDARICLKSFPWTESQQARVLAGDIPPASEILRARAEMRSTASKVSVSGLAGTLRAREFDGIVERLAQESWFLSLPTHLQLYSIRLARGLDARQADSWATWLYCRQLARDGEWTAVHAELRSIDHKRHLEDIDFTKADEGTYFSTNFLNAELTLLSIEARARSGETPTAADVTALMAYADSPRDQLVRFGYGRDDIRPLLETRATQFLRENPEAVPSVTGTFSSIGETIWFVRLNEQAPIRALRSRGGRVELLEPREALRVFEGKVAEDLRSAPDSIKLTNIMRDGDGVVLELSNRTIRITSGDYAHIRSGERLPPTHAVSQLIAEGKPVVIYSNALMREQKTLLREAEQVGFALQEAYPEAAILRDDYSPETATRAEELHNMPPIRTRDVVVVIDNGSFSVDDRNLMADLAPRLEKTGVKVMPYEPGTQWIGRRKRAVIVITGHIDENLTRFVRELGDKGFFRDNYVMLNTCYTEASTDLIAEINQKFGARATLRHEGKIAPYRVGDFTSGLIDDITRHNEAERLHRLVSRRMRAMRLRALWIICRAGGHRGALAETDAPAA